MRKLDAELFEAERISNVSEQQVKRRLI